MQHLRSCRARRMSWHCYHSRCGVNHGLRLSWMPMGQLFEPPWEQVMQAALSRTVQAAGVSRTSCHCRGRWPRSHRCPTMTYYVAWLSHSTRRASWSWQSLVSLQNKEARIYRSRYIQTLCATSSGLHHALAPLETGVSWCPICTSLHR